MLPLDLNLQGRAKKHGLCSSSDNGDELVTSEMVLDRLKQIKETPRHKQYRQKSLLSRKYFCDANSTFLHDPHPCLTLGSSGGTNNSSALQKHLRIMPYQTKKAGDFMLH